LLSRSTDMRLDQPFNSKSQSPDGLSDFLSLYMLLRSSIGKHIDSQLTAICDGAEPSRKHKSL
jgi:hypothetical protein